MREPLLDSLVEQFFSLNPVITKLAYIESPFVDVPSQWLLTYQYNGWSYLSTCGNTKREAICRALHDCIEGPYRFTPAECVERGELPF